MTGPETVESQLTRLMPVMQAWARDLTRNGTAADDLVQDVATKVLAHKDRFTLDTNFKAWVRRIMFNHFISSVRTRRTLVSVEEIMDIPIAAEQHDKVVLDQLDVEFTRLPASLQDALRQIAIEQRSYEDVSKASGFAIGTLKSRVHRARHMLRARLEGSEPVVA